MLAYSLFRLGPASSALGPDDPDILIETAVWDALGIEPGMTESVSVEIPVELIRATEGSEDVDVRSAVEEALKNLIRDD